MNDQFIGYLCSLSWTNNSCYKMRNGFNLERTVIVLCKAWEKDLPVFCKPVLFEYQIYK